MRASQNINIVPLVPSAKSGTAHIYSYADFTGARLVANFQKHGYIKFRMRKAENEILRRAYAPIPCLVFEPEITENRLANFARWLIPYAGAFLMWLSQRLSLEIAYIRQREWGRILGLVAGGCVGAFVGVVLGLALLHVVGERRLLTAAPNYAHDVHDALPAFTASFQPCYDCASQAPDAPVLAVHNVIPTPSVIYSPEDLTIYREALIVAANALPITPGHAHQHMIKIKPLPIFLPDEDMRSSEALVPN